MSRILYVEDEPFLAKIVKESLESRGYEICHVADGSLAVDQFTIFHPHICVLDVMLPNKDGFEIAKEIRKENQQVPIIFLTAKDQVSDVINGFNLGGNDYLKKPFSIEELILRINNLIQLSSTSKGEEKGVYKFGAFSYQPTEMAIVKDDIKTMLSHKENQILKLLVEHRNQKLERKKILMEVWENDSFFNSRTLDVYIRKLRSIFDDDPSVKILTLRGVGYNFYVE